MKIKNFAIVAMTAALLAAPAFAGDNKEGYPQQNREYSNNARYEWNLNPGETIVFKDPVSFEGKVKGINASHTMIEADNGMLIEVPNQGLVWNGDTQVFAQSNAIGDTVVVHLREDEPYRIMSERNDELAIGSYDGVFWVSKAFINDIALDELDDDIYRNNGDRESRTYDSDLEGARRNND